MKIMHGARWPGIVGSSGSLVIRGAFFAHPPSYTAESASANGRALTISCALRRTLTVFGELKKAYYETRESQRYKRSSTTNEDVTMNYTAMTATVAVIVNPAERQIEAIYFSIT